MLLDQMTADHKAVICNGLETVLFMRHQIPNVFACHLYQDVAARLYRSHLNGALQQVQGTTYIIANCTRLASVSNLEWQIGGQVPGLHPEDATYARKIGIARRDRQVDLFVYAASLSRRF